MVWREKENFKIRDVQMDNLRSLTSIRIDGMPDERVKDLYDVKKGVDERTDENVLRCFGNY